MSLHDVKALTLFHWLLIFLLILNFFIIVCLGNNQVMLLLSLLLYNHVKVLNLAYMLIPNFIPSLYDESWK